MGSELAQVEVMVERHRMFGEYLRKARDQKEVTLAVLARYLKCSVPYLSDVENGKRNPLSGEKLSLVAEFLDVSLDVLRTKAAISRGQFKLPVGTAKSNRVAAKLAKAWPNLQDEALRAIERIVEKESA